MAGKKKKDTKAPGRNKSIKIPRPPTIPHGQADGPTAKSKIAKHPMKARPTK